MTNQGTPCPAERTARRHVGFVGAGKVGTTLGRYFLSRSIPVSGYASRTRASAVEAAELTGSRAFASLAELVRESDLIFITAPDSVIASVAHELAASGAPLAGATICHCSGALTAEELAPLRAAGASVGSAHPLLAVSDKTGPLDAMAYAFFTVEGDPAARECLAALLDMCGNRHRAINPADKTRYHAAAVFLSNLAVGLYGEGFRLLEDCGFAPEEARSAASSLIMGNARAVVERGCQAALTGPAERLDTRTIERHLAALGPDARNLYARLSLCCANIAARKHPDRDYQPLKERLRSALDARGTLDARSADEEETPTTPQDRSLL
ncbi:Rossmann-like and DUF2520 domain-containing protein [Rubneribacter sp.]